MRPSFWGFFPRFAGANWAGPKRAAAGSGAPRYAELAFNPRCALRQRGERSAEKRNQFFITKKTSILVVGDQDIRVLNGHERSTKQRKAEKLIAEGAHLRIISESDFQLLLAHVVEIARLTHTA
jgi:DNA polymerase-3 subunit epsilon